MTNILEQAQIEVKKMLDTLNGEYIPINDLVSPIEGKYVDIQLQMRSKTLAQAERAANAKWMADVYYGKEHRANTRKLQEIGGGMKYSNPVVWMMYKYYAYQNGELGLKPIKTLGDLIEHCKSEDYICTKRFHFLNEWLEFAGIGSLRDANIHNPELELFDIFSDPRIFNVVNDSGFMSEWRSNERLEEGDTRTDKWVEYNRHRGVNSEDRLEKSNE